MDITKKLIFAIQILFFTIAVKGQSNYIESLQSSKEMTFVERMQFMEGKEIFEFEGQTLSGKTLNSDGIEGKVAVIYFWFISCPPFIAELNELNNLVEKYKDKEVEFISMTIESKEDLNEYFISDYKFDFEIISDCEEFIVKELNHPFGFPTAFVVDKQGKISRLIIGGSSNEEEAKQNIQSELIPAIEKCLREDKE